MESNNETTIVRAETMRVFAFITAHERDLVVRWLSKEPRKQSDWMQYRKRISAPDASLPELVEYLALFDVTVESGIGEYAGSRVFFWIDSNSKKLKHRLRSYGIREIGFDPTAAPKRNRKVRRGAIK